MSDVMDFVEGFGAAVVDQDPDAVAEALAPWLRRSGGAETFLEEVAETIRGYAEFMEIDPGPVAEFEVSEGAMTLDSLREDSDGVPDEVVEGNYVGWFCLQGIGNERADYVTWFDLWVAVVRKGDDYFVGYYEFMDAN